MSRQNIETKLAAARTRLILDKPFLGALALRLPMIAAQPEWCRTTATDARGFYYNPAYIDSLSIEQTQFVLAHEALHCALQHFNRRQHRVKFRWDIACDHAINPLLVSDGLTPPPGALVLDSFAGMTAEEIYPCIEENSNEETLDKHIYDGAENKGEGQQSGTEKDADKKPPQASPQIDTMPPLEQTGAAQPQPLTAQEMETLSRQWQQRLAGAAQQAQQAGKLKGMLARMMGELLQPKLSWRTLLARYLTQFARDDYSYMRPSRRDGEVILPSLRSAQVDVVIALDTSGSIGRAELDEFISEVNTLKGQVRARVTLHACDSALAATGPWVFEPWEDFSLPQKSLSGGGGTDFRPIFSWVDQAGVRPDLLIYFSDAEGQFPEHEPHYPVFWLIKGSLPVPWGQRIQLN